MRKGVTIAGYFGANNTGDEAILTGMIHALKQQGMIDITVLSRDPEQTKQIHGVNSLYIGRRFDGLGAIYRQFRKSQLFILGGGGLLQDYSSRVVPYWLSRVMIALLAGTPVMYYAQGIGPLRTSKAQRLVRLISNRVEWITVRDQPSLALLKEVGVNRPPTEVTADPALGIQIESDGLALLKQAEIPINQEKIKLGISLRSWDGDHQYIPTLVRSLKQLQEEYDVQIIFFPFQFGEDERISQQILNELGSEEAYLVKGTYTPEQMAAMLKEMDGVIAMRLHAIILSAISHVPSFGLVYDPKVFRFMERAKIDQYSWPIERIKEKEQDFTQRLKDWMANRHEISEQMKRPVEEMKKIALTNAEIAKQLLKFT